MRTQSVRRELLWCAPALTVGVWGLLGEWRKGPVTAGDWTIEAQTVAIIYAAVLTIRLMVWLLGRAVGAGRKLLNPS